jgi:CRP-like cAMP-binding protein
LDKLFAFLTEDEMGALLEAAEARSFAAGDVIIDQNTTLAAMYLLDRGSVLVERDNGPQAVELAILWRGEVFGEISFVDGNPTSARVVAREPTGVKVISRDLIESLEASHPTVSMRFYRSLAAILADRLRATSLKVW